VLNDRPFVPRPRSFSPWRVLALAFVLALPAAGPLSAAGPTAVPQQTAEDVRIVRQFDTSEAVIALTFDAGADRGYAEQILDTLAGRDVKASFGMTGIWAEQNPDLVQRIYAEGHHFINHSWDHPHFPAISSAERVDQLARTDNLVYELTGARTKPYFRPPYGEYNADVLADLAANGYTWMIMWTVDTLGWNGYSASQISERVLAGAAPGAIMLMHVGAASQDAAALPGMIDRLRARGYRFATVEELLTGVSLGERYFPETNRWVRDEFLAYWRRFGGLDIFGYPLTDAFERDGRLLQYFERARFELYPGSWPERYDVVLGRLGSELTGNRIVAGELPFVPIVAGSDANCDFHPETGHRLCFGFREYWRSRGGLAIFGYPISEEFNERNPDTGRVYTVQYFERARFEWHPGEGGTASLVLLGRLGAQLVDAE
jgi:peptidoglycan/xylan/chitin deacetylase (PgdA/CDA1 family)